jgi:hypothetical protein
MDTLNLNPLEAARFHELIAAYGDWRKCRALLKQDSAFYTQAIHSAAQSRAADLQMELSKETPDFHLCEKLIEKLELLTDLLNYLDKELYQ